MMSMVAITPRPHGLGDATSAAKYAIWNDGAQNLRVYDDGGAVRVYKNAAGMNQPYDYKGQFNEGLGDPFRTEPWLGAMNFAPRGAADIRPFCAAFQGPRQVPVQLVFADGSTWFRKGTPVPAPMPTSMSLDGTWISDDGDLAEIQTSAGGQTLKILPGQDSHPWWRDATGSWQNQTGTNPFQGRVTFSDGAERSQFASFCATKDLNTIVFGNGQRWLRK